MNVEKSLSYAQKSLFFRFLGILLTSLLIIELVIGLMLLYGLFNEENKLLHTMATEYQRIIKFDSAKKFIHVIDNNPERLVDNNITIFLQSMTQEAKFQYVGGSIWQGTQKDVAQYRAEEQSWFSAMLFSPYLSIKLNSASGDYWMVLDMSSRYLTVLLHSLNFLAALALLAFIIAIIVWHLIHSTLSPLFMLANRLDKASEGSLDSFSKELKPGKDQGPTGLSAIDQSVSKMVLRLENTIQSMDNTLDAVAHDLRTPLSRIQLAAEKGLLSQGTAQQQTKEMFSALSDCAEGANQTSHMLTTLMKINDEVTGKLELQIEPVDLGQLLRKVSSWYEEIVDEKNITLQVIDNSPMVINTEPNKLTQILINLLDNAFKYTDDGGTISLTYGKNKDNKVYFSVKDNGIGIAKEHQALVFKRLYRVEASRHTDGYGLGLSLVQAMVDNLSGAASVQSKIGEGSVFTISLSSNNTHAS